MGVGFFYIIGAGLHSRDLSSPANDIKKENHRSLDTDVDIGR